MRASGVVVLLREGLKEVDAKIVDTETYGQWVAVRTTGIAACNFMSGDV